MKIESLKLINIDYLKEFREYSMSKGEKNPPRNIEKVLSQVKFIFNISELLPLEFDVLNDIFTDVYDIKMITGFDKINQDKIDFDYEYKEMIKEHDFILVDCYKKTDIDLSSLYSPFNLTEFSVKAVMDGVYIRSFFGSDLFTVLDSENIENTIIQYFLTNFYKLFYSKLTFDTIRNKTVINDTSDFYTDKKILNLIDDKNKCILHSVLGNDGVFHFINSKDSIDTLKEIITKSIDYRKEDTQVRFLLNTSYLTYFFIRKYVLIHEHHYLALIRLNLYKCGNSTLNDFTVRINEIMNQLLNEFEFQMNDENYHPVKSTSYGFMNTKIRYLISIPLNDLLSGKIYSLLNQLDDVSVDETKDIFNIFDKTSKILKSI